MPNYPGGQTYELLALRAAIRRDRAEQRDPKIHGTVAAGLAGGGLATLAGSTANTAFAIPVLQEAQWRSGPLYQYSTPGPESFFTPEKHRELRRAMRTTFTRFAEDPNIVAQHGAAYAAPRSHFAWNKSHPWSKTQPVRGVAFGSLNDPELLAHEYGHAKFSRRAPGRIIQQARLANVSPTFGAKFGLPLGYGSVALGTGAALTSILSDPDSRMSKAAPWIAAAAMTPMLADEAAATINGYRGLRAIGAPRPLLQSYVKRMGLAYGTYASMAAIPVGAALLARHMKKKSKERRQAVFAT